MVWLIFIHSDHSIQKEVFFEINNFRLRRRSIRLLIFGSINQICCILPVNLLFELNKD